MSDGASVLVADGDVRLRAEIGVTLTVSGHTVADAGTAAGAESALRAGPPDVLVLDVSEGFGGLDLLRAVREDPDGPAPGVVVLAPADDPAALAEAMLLGVEAQVVKPVDLDAVLAAVEHVVLSRSSV